jgi:outer membrane lipoprotein SlyB
MSTPGKTHPMIIVAAGAVTLLCGVGVASIMGWIPTAGSESKPAPLQPLQMSATVTPAPGTTVTSATAPMTDTKPAQHVPASQSQPLQASQPAASAPVPAPKPAAKPAPQANSGTVPAPSPAAQAPASPPTPVYAANAPATPRPEKRICANCGNVSSITPIEKKGEGSGAGAVIGGIVGGVLGHQVGGGRGKDVATVAGALGGAVAGNEIEKANKRSVSYEVRVLMEDGTYRTVRYETEPGVRVGDKVRIENGRLIR